MWEIKWEIDNHNTSIKRKRKRGVINDKFDMYSNFNYQLDQEIS